MMSLFKALSEEAGKMQNYLESRIPDEIEMAKERATVLSVYNARSGKMLADAKHILNEKMRSEVMEILKVQAKSAGATSKAINALIDCCCRDEQYLVAWLERINRATVHQIDIIRSMMSYEKEMLRLGPQ